MEYLYFLGDSHNKWEDFKTEVLTKNIRDAYIIQLGDAGFGCFGARKVELAHWTKQNDFLKTQNIILYNIRGNHDNPNWFLPKTKMLEFFRGEDKRVPAWQVNDVYYLYGYMTPPKFVEAITALSNLKFVQDYTVLELLGHRILCIGGAITIDRMMRVKNRDYYLNEPVVHLPAKLKKIKGVDIVATHTIPDFIPPVSLKSELIDNYRKHDTKLLDDLKLERETMTKIYHDIVANNAVDKWFYGHFHRWNNTHYGGTDGVQFLCLPPNKTYKLV